MQCNHFLFKRLFFLMVQVIVFLNPAKECFAQSFSHVDSGAVWLYRFSHNSWVGGSHPNSSESTGKLSISVASTQTVNDTFKWKIDAIEYLETSSVGIPYELFPPPIDSVREYTLLLAFFNDSLFTYNIDSNGITIYTPFIRYAGRLSALIPIPLISKDVADQKIIKSGDLQILYDTIIDHSDTTWYLNGIGPIYTTHNDLWKWQGSVDIFRLVNYNGTDFDVTYYIPDIDTMLTAIVNHPKRRTENAIHILKRKLDVNCTLLGRILPKSGYQRQPVQVIINQSKKRLFVTP